MGWGIFGKVGSWLRKTVGKVGDVAKNVAGKVGSGMDWVRDKISKGYDALSNVPIVGDAVKLLATNPIVSSISNAYDGVRGAVNSVNQGDYTGALAKARSLANSFTGKVS